jgi:hypothetical protein
MWIESVAAKDRRDPSVTLVIRLPAAERIKRMGTGAEYTRVRNFIQSKF